MRQKRRNFSAGFKAKVALEAIRGELSLSALATKHGVHAIQISKWKKEALLGMEGIFGGNSSSRKDSHEEEIKELHAKIGQLLVEKDFLRKAFGQ